MRPTNTASARVALPSQLGQLFRSRRKARGLTQADVASQLGISQARLSILETEPAGLTLERLLALANLLGLEIVVQDKTSAPKTKSEW